MNDNTEQGNGVDGELQAHIGRKLKAAYDDILGQPVPDRFLELLKALEEKEKGQQGDEAGTSEAAR
jgi:hypothetical protein